MHYEVPVLNVSEFELNNKNSETFLIILCFFSTELRKRSTLSEGEEPDIHFPFQTSPFDKETLCTPICGRTIFVSPDPSVSNNNNSFKEEAILKELHIFGEGFIEKSSSSDSKAQQEEDSIFMSLNGK